MDHIKIFFVFIGAGVESLAECKIQEKKGQKIFWFLFGIIMIVAPTIWMVSQIREFLEVIYKRNLYFRHCNLLCDSLCVFTDFDFFRNELYSVYIYGLLYQLSADNFFFLVFHVPRAKDHSERKGNCHL